MKTLPLLTSRNKGFTLILTITLMVLITLVTVGLLTLSSVSLRSSVQADAASTARANAKMSLMLAIGELQRQTGADTRVTARADVLDAYNPPVLGVWKSWQGGDHETSGPNAARPKPPISNYRTTKNSRFLAWLTSANFRNAATLPDTAPGTDKVTLVGKGSVTSKTEPEKLQIHLTPTPVVSTNRQGNLAWWIGGENQKARLPKPYKPDNAASVARWSVHAKSHAIADTEPFRMDGLLTDAAPADKAISLRQADLVAVKGAGEAAVATDYFHDLSAVSVGLLTNTANGGWRKDFSLLSESWSKQPSSGLPLFRVTPSSDISYRRPAPGNAVPATSMFYPWAAYRGGDTIPIYQHGPVTSWENLMDYATFYKRVSASSSGNFSTSHYAISIGGDSYSFLHKVRILPVIARMQWIFSHSAGPATPPDPSGTKLAPRLLVTPVITMWNPYNVEVTTPSISFGIPKPLPTALRYTINGLANSNYNSVMGGGYNYSPAMGSGNINFSINEPLVLKPGESRVFSPESNIPVSSNSSLNLKVGYRSGGGHFFPILNNSGVAIQSLPASSTIKADAKFDSYYVDRGQDGVGIYLDAVFGGSWDLAYRMVYTPAVANVVYKPLTQLASATLNQCKTNPIPFLSTMFGTRTASRTHLAAKGFVQSSPFVYYTNMGFKDLADIGRHYGGTGHPVNSPFDYSFVKHAPGGDSLLPNANDTTGRGYIVTGFTAAEGLSRCVVCELPCRPINSIGELVNWDLRYENSVPPFAFNLIGNSDATPVIPANAVVNSVDANFAENLQHDDSYCANHLLFDDWFASSIAPDPTNFGSSGKSQQVVFNEFVTGKTPLQNRAYRPLPVDQATALTSTTKATKLFTDYVSKDDSWKSIASRLQVEGMFNVNSTSVTAWRALLGHARNQRVPYVRETATTWDTGLSNDTDYAFTRFSIAGDAKAGTPSTSGSFPEANEFAGYRTVDDKFLDALAEKVVDQIRKRGPFLSLAEFVNRQLSSGDLALAGTIQAALNEVAKSPATNIFSKMEALSTTAVAVPERSADAEYKFPAAAVGKSAYGMPGWTRQADILRPLFPILSARDDTFTVRGYGDARDAAGKIIARAVCEGVVRRGRDFVNPIDPADSFKEPVRADNKYFGRRYQMISFRWLAPDEV